MSSKVILSTNLTSYTKRIIRENQLHMLDNVLQTGGREGMVMMDNCLYDLYCRCMITYDTAMSRAREPERIRNRIDRNPANT